MNGKWVVEGKENEEELWQAYPPFRIQQAKQWEDWSNYADSSASTQDLYIAVFEAVLQLWFLCSKFLAISLSHAPPLMAPLLGYSLVVAHFRSLILVTYQ
jgi:hypothetical protein